MTYILTLSIATLLPRRAAKQVTEKPVREKLSQRIGRKCSNQSINIFMNSFDDVSYTSMYHGFLAADRRRTKPPGAVTRYSSATSESASTLPGENQSRWSMITERVIDRDGSPRRTLQKGRG